MKRITIELSDDIGQRLENLSALQRMSVEKAAADIVQRRLMLSRFDELCAESESLANGADFNNENEVLRNVS